jgi:D-3-phosphoglycerate dehydrogenase
MATEDVQEIEIEYEGLVAGLNTKPLTSLALSGFLKPSMEGVNIVSAPARAKERGIGVAETKREKTKDFQTLIRITVKGKTGTHSVAGTLFGGEHPRLVTVDLVPVEAALMGEMLFIKNLDKPGLIGAVGMLLGNASINIADFNLGRIAGQNKAIALISVDGKIGDDITEAIDNLEQVERVQVLRF